MTVEVNNETIWGTDLEAHADSTRFNSLAQEAQTARGEALARSFIPSSGSLATAASTTGLWRAGRWLVAARSGSSAHTKFCVG